MPIKLAVALRRLQLLALVFCVAPLAPVLAANQCGDFDTEYSICAKENKCSSEDKKLDRKCRHTRTCERCFYHSMDARANAKSPALNRHYIRQCELAGMESKVEDARKQISDCFRAELESSWEETSSTESASARVNTAGGDSGSAVEGAMQQAPEAQTFPPAGVWEGDTVCDRGREYVRLSIEPGRAADDYRVVYERLDAPGGRALARKIGRITEGSTNRSRKIPPEIGERDFTLRLGNRWVMADVGEPKPSSGYTFSLDLKKITDLPDQHSACQGYTLVQIDPALVSGGFSSAQELPSQMRGGLYCNETRQLNIEFAIKPISEKRFDGVVRLGPSLDNSAGRSGSFTVIGEFDPSAGEFTAISDRWMGPGKRPNMVFDMVATLRDGGNRAVAFTSLPGCKLVELNVPGSEITAGVQPLAMPKPITNWNTPSACLTGVYWASQALEEAGVKSFYGGISVGQAEKIGLGLLHNDRFTPFFGKSYENLSAGEKDHLDQVRSYCKDLLAIGPAFNHSGARFFFETFFPTGRRAKANAKVAVSGARIRLLRDQMNREMSVLNERIVGEADIVDLERQQTELAARYADLWSIDSKAAQELIRDKLNVARGDLEQRLVAEIAALPESRDAFSQTGSIVRGIDRLNKDKKRQAKLKSVLNRRLADVSDELFAQLASEYADDPLDLVTAGRFARALNQLWPVVQRHVAPSADGLREISSRAQKLAEASYAEFEIQSRRRMSPATNFYERQAAYRLIVDSLDRYTPNVAPVSHIYTRFLALVESLRPVPTREDLVNADGSPSNLGLKFAVSEYIDSYSNMMRGLIQYNIPQISELVRVAAVQKDSCTSAQEGSYWCNYNIRVSSQLPFITTLLGMVGHTSRLAFRGKGWKIVEVPRGGGGPSSSGEMPCGMPMGCSAGEIGAMGVMGGLW